jgi:hypothetical protein
MNTIGHPITIVNDETGEEYRVRFPDPFTMINSKTGEKYQVCVTDNSLSRQISAIYETCHTFGLDDEEMMAVWLFLCLYKRKINGVQLRRFGKVGVHRSGVDKLVARGWFVVEGKIVHAAHRPEWKTICQSSDAAELFGVDRGRA